VERGDVDLPSEPTADVGSDAAGKSATPARLPDFLLAAAVDDAVIGDVLADLPEAQPERSLHSATDFSSLYVRHRSGLAAHARRYLRDSRDVDEVVQETFLRLFLAISEIETELQAIAFARRTLTNLCIDRYRADRRRPTLITLDASPYFEVNGEEQADPVLQAEDAAIVRDALARLSPLHRAALVKREIEEKALPQIAAELGVAEESVKHLLFRARRALRRLLVGTSVEPGIDLTDADGSARQPSPLLRGAGVFVILLIGALLVATGLRPLSGGDGSRPATEAVGRLPLTITGPDDLAPKGSEPKPTHRHRPVHPTGSAPSELVTPTSPTSSRSSDSSVSPPDITLGQPAPAATHHHPPATGSRGHFRLSGPLKVTSAPRVVQSGALADGSGGRLAASSFTAATDHGRFDLNQSVSRASDGGTSVVVRPSFVVAGVVEQPVVTGSAAAIGDDAAGNVTVDVALQARPGPSAQFQLTSLTAHFELSPDLSEVLNESVTLATRPADGAGSPTVANGSSKPAKPPASAPKPPQPPAAAQPVAPEPVGATPPPSTAPTTDATPGCPAPGGPASDVSPAGSASGDVAACPTATAGGPDTNAADSAATIRQ
jgi:RNA polymerase sigma factor (sigma-70 family)